MTAPVEEPRKESPKFTEVRMILSTIGGLWFGRKVWLPEEKRPDTAWVDDARDKNVPVAIVAYRQRLESESEGIEAVRKRAEFALTAVIAAAGLSASGSERLWASSSESAIPLSLWFIGLGIEVFAVLAFAGVAVASKALGHVDPSTYSSSKHPERKELRAYIQATHTTSKTRRAAVTVFRDAFVIALVGLIPLGIAHVSAWATPLPVEPLVVHLLVP